MRRPIILSVVVLISVIAAAQRFRNGAAKPAPSFAGKWELAALELKPMVHRNGHTHPQIAPRVRPMTITVAQGSDSITVRIDVLDSLGNAATPPVSRTYRLRPSISGAMSSPSLQMQMRIDRRTGILELLTVKRKESPESGDAAATSTETWRLGLDGTLERRVHDTSAEGSLDRVETWRRLASK